MQTEDDSNHVEDQSVRQGAKETDQDAAYQHGTDLVVIAHRNAFHDVGVKTINKFNPIPYSTLKNSYFVVYRRGLGNI